MRAVGCLFRGCSSTWFACLAPHIVPVYVVFALVAASVPGEIHTDLFNAHKIGEPYYRFNDVSLMLSEWPTSEGPAVEGIRDIADQTQYLWSY